MKKQILFLVFIAACVAAQAQNIGINNPTPAASALLDLTSANKGLLVPRVALTASNSNAPIGGTIVTSLLVYNTATAGVSPNNVTPGYYYWDGAKWVRLIGGSGTTGDAWTTTGNAGTIDGTNFIGTTDNVPLNFKVSGSKAGRIDNTLGNAFYGFQSGNVTTAGSNSFFGHQSGLFNTTGIDNAFFGRRAGQLNTTGSLNSFFGAFAGDATSTGGGNSFFGTSAGQSNTTGANNSIFGKVAGANATTASGNSFFGQQSGVSTITGSNNSFFGHFSGTFNTTGFSNVAVGVEALSLNSSIGNLVAVGDSALRANTTGGQNTALGSKAGLANTTGTGNSFIGYNAGLTNITGSSNTLIGNIASANVTNLINATAIGSFARVDASNAMVLGSVNGVNSATATVNVGIGVNNPLDRLHVAGNIRMVDGNQAAGKVMTSDVNGTATWQTPGATSITANNGLTMSTATNAQLGGTLLQNTTIANGGFNLNITGTGNVGISNSAPSHKLHVSGGVRAENSFFANDGTVTQPAFTFNSGSTLGIYTPATNVLAVSTSNTERMRVSATGNVGIATNAPLDKLHVVGNIRMVDGNQAAGKVLTSDVNGTATWQTLGASSSAWNITGNAGTVDGTNFIGTTDNVPFNIRVNNIKAGRIDNTLGNAFYGFQSGNVTTGVQNSFFGHQAGLSNTTGIRNSFFGEIAGRANTTGFDNSFFGTSAGDANTTGSSNSFFGKNSGGSNITGFSNVAIGVEALRNNFSTSNLVAVGDSALKSNVTGLNNTGVGSKAGLSNIAGHNNAWFGYEAGKLTTNSFNSFFGARAGTANTTGTNNSFFGEETGAANVSGNGNAFFGQETGSFNTTGAGNSFFGRQSGLTNTTGNFNTLIGNDAEVNANNLTNATAIGTDARVDASNAMVLGSVNGVNSATATVNVGIGVNNPLDRLHVVGNIRMVDGNQAAGKVMTSDVNGTATWQTPGASSSAWNITGNAGTVDGTNFIGTTDNVPFNIRVNNQKAGRIDNTLENAFFGFQSGNTNSGSQNSFFGMLSGQVNSTGSGNSYFGNVAGGSNTTGANNSMFGSLAGVSVTTGNSNTIFGKEAGRVSTTGSRNTFIGDSSAFNSVSGSNNTIIGYQSNTNANNLTNATAIGANAQVDASNAMVLGSVNGVNSATATVNVGIGVNTPLDRLHVVGNIRMVDGNQAPNKVMVSDANGTATWQAFSALVVNAWGLTGNAGTIDGTNFIGTTDDVPFNIRVNNQEAGRIDNIPANAFYGYQAGMTNNTGISNTFVGHSAGRLNNNGSGNSFFGKSAGINNTSGGSNSFFGLSAGGSNTTANGNSFIGHQSGVSTTTGSNNSFLGFSSGFFNTTGFSNVAVGVEALRNNSVTSNLVAIGDSALRASTGVQNTAVGSKAGLASTTGTGNSYFGYNAGLTNSTGSSNTFVGNIANVNANNLINASAIGANARVDASNAMVLGSVNGINGATSNVNVGIGTTIPASSALLDLTSTDKGLLVPRVALTATNSNAPVGGSIVTSLLVYNTATTGTAPNNVTPGYYYWDGVKWARYSTSSSDYYSTVGTSIATATSTMALMPEMQLSFIPKDTIAFVNFSAAGSNQNGCGQTGANFLLMVNGNSILPFHTTIEDLTGSNAKVWDVTLNYPINLIPDVSNTVQIFWRASCTNLNNGPGAQLSPNGSYRHLNILVPTGYGIINTNSPSNPNDWSTTGNTGTNPNSNFVGTIDNAELSIKTSNTDRMRITSAGNVGIGITAPVQKFEVLGSNGIAQTTGSAQNGIARFQALTNSASMDFGVNTGTINHGWIQMRLVSNYATNFNLSLNPNGGNVGIGTTSPSERLEIEGLNSVAATTGAAQNAIARFQPAGSGLTFDVGASGASPAHAWMQARDNGNYATNFNLSLNPNGGNVGIGTTAPLITLQVGSTSSGEYGLQKGDASPNAGYLRFGDNSGWKFHIGRLRESIAGAVNTTITGAVMTVQDNGNVGIGTTSPAVKLDVSGSISILNNNNLTWGGAFGAGIPTIASTVSDGIYFYPTGSTSGATMKINSSGNVGIGTTAPGDKLHVVGNIRMVDGNQAAGKVMTSDVNGLGSWQSVGASAWGLTGNTGTVDGTNFIGTTDNVPFHIRVNNQLAGRIDGSQQNTFFGHRAGEA
ncbi:MAG: hypothetical protein JJE25_08310, partial [Bacteroidia bacterium]|nr:hypothetical protein [Bacteroidia bacterium]